MPSRNHNVKTRNSAQIYTISILMIILSVLMLTPIFVMLLTSLKTPAEVNSPSFVFIPKKPMFSNYLHIIGNQKWARYFFNSIVITSISTVVSLFFNSCAGYAFARLKFVGRSFFFLFLMVGLLVPPQVLLVPVFIIIRKIPLAGGNDILGNGGVGLVNTYIGVILPYLAGAFGVFLCRQYYLNFPTSIDEAAEIDGCSKWRTFLSVYLPQSRPLVASLGVLKLTYVWNDYAWPLVALNTERMKTVQLALSGMKYQVIEWEKLMAATTLVVLPLVLVFLFAQRYFVQGIATSGLKG